MTFSTRALRAGSMYLHPAIWERLMGPSCTSSPRPRGWKTPAPAPLPLAWPATPSVTPGFAGLPSLTTINRMILIPALNNAVAFNGDFLLASSSDAAGSPTVCRVIQAVNAEELIVTWLLTRDQILQRQNLERPPSIPFEVYTNIVQCILQELFEVRSSFNTIRIGSVLDIAFVFHVNTLESKIPNCAGMTRFFFVRYYYDENNVLVELHHNEHVPFSQVIIDSYPCRIWYTIVDVKDRLEKCLNDKKQYQMCKKMLSMPCSLEAWTFLAINLVRGGAVVVQFKGFPDAA